MGIHIILISFNRLQSVRIAPIYFLLFLYFRAIVMQFTAILIADFYTFKICD